MYMYALRHPDSKEGQRSPTLTVEAGKESHPSLLGIAGFTALTALGFRG